MFLKDNLEKFKQWMVSTFPHIGSDGSSGGHPLYILFSSVKDEIDDLWQELVKLKTYSPLHQDAPTTEYINNDADKRVNELSKRLDNVESVLVSLEKLANELEDEFANYREDVEEKLSSIIDLIADID